MQFTEELKIIEGLKTNLVEISESDASDIILLRNNPEFNRFLSSHTPISLDAQIEWIKKNRERKDNFYFKITDKQHVFKGTISLYGIENNSAEFGRFISMSSVASVEAEYLILKFAFDELNLNRVYCKTIEENQKVIQMHTRFGFKTIGIEKKESLNKPLIVQEMTREEFQQHDFRPILSLIEKIK